MAFKKVGPPPKSLPPLPRLRVRKPILSQSSNSCMVLMSSLLNCWASNGEGSQACLSFANDLKYCMENQQSLKVERSTINYHAQRLYPKLKGKKLD
ncbi:conserved hypothetical protein [Lodderomyces elongisporus NRRL YB-4239]|uniref:Small ribosomal subunit protein mS37 n=1 Tax=Lodderomyces elongisporus (strain ATCC 11503 / CBS 2605 / JCM 1781 / NBRC 1676 / NRRL YB-4239) TaxID=379508 RepID=A5E2H1_LODEL|nr:conserved hypothetical protein [Lodderomyces elongisporus NRRL YB-4239]